MSGWRRVRRVPGFKLVHESEIRSEVGHEYEIPVVCLEGRLRYYVDERLVHDMVDSSPLPGGRFVIRTWDTHAWWGDVGFGHVIEELQ